jgi:hypothetical protein
MAGEFTGTFRPLLMKVLNLTPFACAAGLSGGQRKLLLFELIHQRTKNQSDLLLVLDEPFAGVTDDFVPFIVARLNEMRQKHNILLVTNDHVETLKTMADNTITVSALDRSMVQLNGKAQVDRTKMMLALSVGEEYRYDATWDDLRFFYDVEGVVIVIVILLVVIILSRTGTVRYWAGVIFCSTILRFSASNRRSFLLYSRPF